MFACGVQDPDGPTGQDATTTTASSESTATSANNDTSESTADTTGATNTGTAGDPGSTSTPSLPVDPGTTSAAGETTGEAGESSSGAAETCGDGVVQAGEECDDPGDLHCHACVRDRLVFVTSQGFQGDWAKSGVDYWCNHLAAQAGLITDNQPRFKPWASTSGASAAERLHHSRGRYVLVNDLVFAASWDDLIAGNLLNPLDVDENGQTRDYPVWTGTAPDGTAAADNDFCGDWTSDSFTNYGHYGYSFRIDGDWTFLNKPVNPTVCGAEGSLYCFESP